MKYLPKIVLLLVCLNPFLSKSQVGINTTTPLSTLDINGTLSLKTLGIATPFVGGPSGNATLINSGIYVSLTPTAAAPEFYLPTATSLPGRIYILRNIDNTVTAKLYAAPPGLLFAKDSNTATTQPLLMPGNGPLKTVIVISDGANWTYIF